jgi:hypothetical protein
MNASHTVISSDASSGAPAIRRRWLLAAAVLLELGWITLLTALVVMR